MLILILIQIISVILFVDFSTEICINKVESLSPNPSYSVREGAKKI